MSEFDTYFELLGSSSYTLLMKRWPGLDRDNENAAIALRNRFEGDALAAQVVSLDCSEPNALDMMILLRDIAQVCPRIAMVRARINVESDLVPLIKIFPLLHTLDDVYFRHTQLAQPQYDHVLERFRASELRNLTVYSRSPVHCPELLLEFLPQLSHFAMHHCAPSALVERLPQCTRLEMLALDADAVIIRLLRDALPRITVDRLQLTIDAGGLYGNRVAYLTTIVEMLEACPWTTMLTLVFPDLYIDADSDSEDEDEEQTQQLETWVTGILAREFHRFAHTGITHLDFFTFIVFTPDDLELIAVAMEHNTTLVEFNFYGSEHHPAIQNYLLRNQQAALVPILK